jgi:hypothetical protein
MITELHIKALEWALHQAESSIGGADPNDYEELNAQVNIARAAIDIIKAQLPLHADPSRLSSHHRSTGIYVRAYIKGKIESVDIATLTTESLERWLRGNDELLAMRCVMLFLGHKLTP